MIKLGCFRNSKTITPDFQALVQVVVAGATHRNSLFHGVSHWQRVAWAGYSLLNEQPAADPLVVLLFALIHDSKRENDGWDEQHGLRAAAFVRELQGRWLRLPRHRLDLLTDASRRHADGYISDDPTIGLCWDADRLNLWRVGIKPDPSQLSTAAARRETRIEWAEKIQDQHFSWSIIARAYGV